MSIIKAKLNDREIEFITLPEIVSGDENLNMIAVMPDASWQMTDADFYMSFYTSDISQSIVTPMENDGNICVCAVPNKMTEQAGIFHFGVFVRVSDGTYKISKIAEYRVKKGISTAGTGKDTISASALKSKFIKLINDNAGTAMLDERMNFDNEIDPTYTNYMARINVIASDYVSFADDIFNIIKTYISPEADRIDDIELARIFYPIVLEEYIKNSVPKISFDSVSDELNLSGDRIDQLSAELEQKTTVIENIKTIFETFYSGDDINSNT